MSQLNPAGIIRPVEENKKLAELAVKINAGHNEIKRFEKMTLTKAKEVGDWLIEAKKLVPHGQWEKWRKDNVNINQSISTNYMTIANNWKQIIDANDLIYSIRGAIRYLQELDSHNQESTNNIPDVNEEPGFSTDDVGDEEVSEELTNEEEDTSESKRMPLPTTKSSAEDTPRSTAANSGSSGGNGKSTGGKIGKVGEYITLDDWKKISVPNRVSMLKTNGDTKFNSQENNSIEWALWSWNPVTGCKHDCPYCYARDIANRFYETKFEPTLWFHRLKAPFNTTFPEDKIYKETDPVRKYGLRNVFTCSMADLFGRWVPKEWIDAVLKECTASPQWNFLFLTKFPNRMSEFVFPDNCWVGTTVDCQARVKNAEKSFRKVKAKVKWLSCEPLLEPLKFDDLGAFQWVVIGGSSKSNQTPDWCPPNRWITQLKHAAWTSGCKVYEKTNLYPTDIGEARVREYPGIDFEDKKTPEGLIYLPKEIG